MPQPGSALVVTHRARSNPFYAAAVGQIPGYLDAVELHTAAKAKKQAVLYPQVRWPDTPTAADDLDKYLAAYQAAHDEQQRRNNAVTALDNVIGQAERAMYVATADPDQLFATLADDLDDLMARVTDAVRRLKGATTPLDAINAGTANVWRELPDLRAEYDKIRHAQELVRIDCDDMVLTNYRSQHINDPLADDTQLANMDQLIPDWREPDHRMNLQGDSPDRRPWPTDDCQQLVWLVTSDAHVWLPTRSELADLRAERTQRWEDDARERADNHQPPKTTPRHGVTLVRPGVRLG